MPPEDKMFFTYFQDSAEICQKTARLYDKIMHDKLTDEYKEKALKYKKKGKLSYKAVLKQLNKSFITPIEREDIQTIAVQLNKITKKIVKACLNLEVYRLNDYTDEMKEQALTLVQATDKLAEIVKLFKKVSDVEKITKLNTDANFWEVFTPEEDERYIRNTIKRESEKKGEQRKSCEIARNMLAKNLDLNLIMDVTNLSKNEIMKLQ